MTHSSRTTPQDSHVGPRSTGGKAGAVQTPANSHLGQDKPGIFDERGAVGKQFTRKLPQTPMSLVVSEELTTDGYAAEGTLGGAAQKVGGPLDKEGMIGKQFTTEGSIGGTVQNMMGGTSKKSN